MTNRRTRFPVLETALGSIEIGTFLFGPCPGS